MRCSRCTHELTGDLAPAEDAFTGLPVCDNCTRVERHVRRRANGGRSGGERAATVPHAPGFDSPASPNPEPVA